MNPPRGAPPERSSRDFLGVLVTVSAFTGRCIAVIHRADDDDDKLVVVPDGRAYTDEQIRALTEFQERWHVSVVWRW